VNHRIDVYAIKRSIYIIREVFNDEWHNNWVNNLRDKTINVFFDLMSEEEDITTSDIIRIFTDKSEEFFEPVPHSSELLETNEHIWKKIQYDIISEYDTMVSNWASVMSCDHEIILPDKLSQFISFYKSWNLDEATDAFDTV